MIVQSLSCIHTYKPSLKNKNIYRPQIFPLLPPTSRKRIRFCERKWASSQYAKLFFNAKIETASKEILCLEICSTGFLS